MDIAERLGAADGIDVANAEIVANEPDCHRISFTLAAPDGSRASQRAIFMRLPSKEYALVPVTARQATGLGSAKLSTIYSSSVGSELFDGEVIGALNGGFFIFIERLWCSAARFVPSVSRVGDPIGWRMTAGQTAFPPLYGRAALLFGGNSGARAAYPCLIDMTLVFHWRDGTESCMSPSALNCEETAGVACYTPAWNSPKSPKRPRAIDVSVVGATTVSSRAGGRSIIPINGFVLSATMEEWGLAGARTFAHPARVAYALNAQAQEKYGGASRAIEAGPALVSNGIPIEIDTERLISSGFAPGTPPLPAFNSVLNHYKIPAPRTCVGIAENGDAVATVFEGRMPGASEGVTLNEAARLMAAIGCRDAVNLDGGASSQMILRGVSLNQPQLGESGGWITRALKLANRLATPGTLPMPGDIGAGGEERAIGDALLIVRL
jgi:hypothetical protein